MVIEMQIKIENQIVKILTDKKWKISFAESCTGGLMVATLVNASGCSNVLSESYVTYSEEAKMKILSVKKETLNRYSVYSKEVAIEMAKGLQKITNSNVSVSVTGLAEAPDNNCKCDYAIIINDTLYVEEVSFNGTRYEVRTKQVNHILNRILALINQ